MTPEELARQHPKLFHVTRANALPLIERHGLMSTNALLDLFETAPLLRSQIAARPRKTIIELWHPNHGLAQLNHQKPLIERSLTQCLIDDLSVPDWIEKLNSRVFLWPDEKRLSKFLAASTKAGFNPCILCFDTLSLTQELGDHMEISPMNSGNTTRKALRRGNATFAKLTGLNYRAWQKDPSMHGLRQIKEVIVKHQIPDALAYVTAVRHF